MTTNLTALLHLTDPTLPIGGFNHSGGLETFVQENIITNRNHLQEYVQAQLLQNWVYNDGAYVSLAHDATCSENLDALIALDEEICANKTPREIREASIKLGIRLLKIFARPKGHAFINEFMAALHDKQVQAFYPLVFGLVAASMGQTKEDTLTALYYNMVVGTITNGVKLIPLSQNDGQDILFALHGDIDLAVKQSITPDTVWLGVASTACDIRAMRHERLYTRLYMS